MLYFELMEVYKMEIYVYFFAIFAMCLIHEMDD